MHTTHRLPTPDKVALAHSQHLQHHIVEHIQGTEAQAISFHDYMQMALYQPGLGYYVAGASKLGADGDFITAPELSPLYSQCIAMQCQQVLTQTQGNILEFGAGSGIMAAHILNTLGELDCLPTHYFILDVSPDLQQRQQATLQRIAPQYCERVQWLQKLPISGFTGIMLANEVLDAMPVELFRYEQQQWQQVNITADYTSTVEQTPLRATLQPAPAEMQQALAKLKPPEMPTYQSEYNPHITPWLNSLSDCLLQGVILLIDYGYNRDEYYHPDRSQGTLLCHYRHHAHDDFLLWPGLQDITASVDFTAVADAAEQTGLKIAGYTPQGQFLINTELEQLFLQSLNTQPKQQYELAQQVRTLTLPSDMGERFRVMALQKAFTLPLRGFTLGDQSHRL